MRLRGFCAAILVAVSPAIVLACGSNGDNGGGTPPADAASPDTDAGASQDVATPPHPEAGDGGSYLDAAPIPLPDLCPLFTHDLCIYLTQCLHAPYRDLAHCEAELDCFGLPQLQAAAAEGGVIYDPAQVGQCNARFLQDPCGFGFFLYTPDIFQVLAYCPGTITPKLTDGGPCISSGECTQGLYCNKPKGCPGTCIPYSQVGQSCTGSLLCDPHLDCTSMTSGPLTDVCENPPKEGDPCTTVGCGSTENCPADPTLCTNPNLYCDPASHSCKPGVGAGAPCGAPADGGAGTQIACASNLWCDQVFLDQPGTCRVASGMGGPCNDIGCATGLHCAGYVPLGAGATLGTCTGPSPDGGACSKNADCQGNAYCGNGVCGGGKPLNSTCAQDTDCQSGLTCSSGTCLHAAYPGDACDGTTTACVLSLCKNGTCVDHAKVGQPCVTGTDCATGTCYQGTCADTSVCPVP
jgi:hypothetical protein